MNIIRTGSSLITAIALTSGLPVPAPARLSKAWSFEELSARADLIVIISAIRDDRTTDSFKQGNLSQFIGINTRFDVHVVLKGKLTTKELTVLHFLDKASVTNGPNTADFRYTRTYEEQIFKDGKPFGRSFSGEKPEKPTLIAFLKARGDGRFEPVTGQYDSADSFYELIDSFGGTIAD